jgi:hypothetical protein
MLIVAAVAVVVLGATRLVAHDEFRIIGTVSKRQPAQVDVKSREGKLISIKINAETLVYRDNKKITAAEVQPGKHVVVDALGDSLEDLLALEIRLIASLPK